MELSETKTSIAASVQPKKRNYQVWLDDLKGPLVANDHTTFPLAAKTSVSRPCKARPDEIGKIRLTLCGVARYA